MSGTFNRLAVAVLTTEGPSYIQRIAQEHPEVRSVICLNGTSNALPISAAYDAFVREPTGIVQRAVGHPVFRMDVSDPIDDGQSWQLGAFLAHLLSHQSEFSSIEEADAVIFATGQVDRDLAVQSVDHVPNKLSAAREIFEVALSAGKRVFLAAPAENLASYDQEQLPAGVEVIPAETVSQVMERLDGRAVTAALPLNHQSTEKSSGYPWKTGLLAVMVLAAAAFVFEKDIAGYLKQPDPQVSKPVAAPEKPEKIAALSPAQTDKMIAGPQSAELNPEDIEARILVLNPRGDLSCSSSVGDLVPADLPSDVDAISEGCGLRAELSNRSDIPVQFGALIFADGNFREYSRSGNYIAAASGTIKPGQSKNLSLQKPTWLKRAFEYRVLIAVFNDDTRDIAGRITRFKRQLTDGAAGELPGWDDGAVWSLNWTIRYVPN